MYKFLLFFICLLSANVAFAIPNGPLPDATFDKNIRTVQFYKEGWEFSYPILEFGDNKQLILCFDVLENQYKNYTYSVIHCNADWTQSRIPFQEYMDGFFQNSLFDYQQSFSTHLPYMHYELKIPNENVKLKLSGNYVVLVYEDGNDNEPVLIKRFTIVEPKVQINARVKRPTLPKFNDRFQEVDFTVIHSDFSIENPYQTIKVAIVKNNLWKFSITDLKPLFIRDKEIVYDYEDNNLFPGGNEYRSIDTKTLKYQQANFQSIDFAGDKYEVVLKPEKRRDLNAYFSYDDLNGKFLVQNQQGSDAKVDAEYVNVKFRLQSFQPVLEGDVYVFGGFTDFNCYDDYKMIYNKDEQMYELNALIKQGYFNYLYVLKPQSKDDVDEQFFEGSYYETENDYIIYVYYKPFGGRYDQLIGSCIVNSIKFK
jgi:hypothetical protein